MDFGRNVSLKENYTFFVANSEGQVATGPDRVDSLESAVSSEPDSSPPTEISEWGLYNRDTRFLSRYQWCFSAGLQTLLLHSQTPDRLHAHLALLGHHQQFIAVDRELVLSATGFVDRLTVEATGVEPRQLTIELAVDADYADLFEVRGWGASERQVERKIVGQGMKYHYRAADGLEFATHVTFSTPPDSLSAQRARFELELEPGERWELEVGVELATPLEDALPAPGYREWRQQFAGLTVPPEHREITERAIDDLRALLLFTEEGPFPAAGIPWYVAAFGRDALLCAAMLLPWAPQVARGTLRFLARHQGKEERAFQAEAPGKIMHELRYGEMTRTGRVPHSPYYGTVDATPLFVVLLGRLLRNGEDPLLVKELQPNWEAALRWMEREGDRDGDGFLEFTPAPPGKGLNVQSWKDSEDSMSHRDGSLAPGELAVSEVQGYAYEAYLAAASFYSELGEEGAAGRYRQRAQRLQKAFHEAFWLEELGTYAMALDGEKRPLAVHNSDAGHLLWSGLVPEEFAPRLVETLLGPETWSGWGFRTLGRDEVRYNPVSYHNGSVWPHDSALIAGGLRRYGFEREAGRVREALLEMARSQVDLRLPELVAGYERKGAKRIGPEHSGVAQRLEPSTADASSTGDFGSESSPPIPYPVACRPQAWDAAAVVYLLGLGEG